MANWKGTPIPTSGYVEKIYINTAISNYYNILKNVTFTDASALGQSGFSFYPVMAFLGSSSIPYVLAFKKFSDADIDFALINFSNMSTTQDFFIGDKGWQSFVNPYNIGYEVLPTLSGLPIGNQNELLTEMISITPFEEIVDPILNLPEFLTGIADAIRSKKGTTAPINAQNFATEIESIESGGGVDYLGLRLTQTEEYEYSNSEVTTIPEYSFYYDKKIKKATFQNVTFIKREAFYHASVLQNIQIPNITDINNSVFAYCSELTDISLPKVTFVSGNSFEYCTKLANISVPGATTISSFAFRHCENISNVNFPLLTKLDRDSFEYCYSLRSVYIPIITSIGNLAFSNCYSLLAVIITQTNKVTTLGGNVFASCYHILGTANETYNPSGAKDGYIYVPDSLVEDYKAATNWSNYATQIKGLSELPQEYADLYGIEIPEAPEASGYTLTLNSNESVYNSSFNNKYSIDGGNTWNVIDKAQIVLENVTTFKFQTDSTYYMYSIGTTQGGNDILHNFISGETEEITLNADTTWYISSAVGGGYD